MNGFRFWRTWWRIGPLLALGLLAACQREGASGERSFRALGVVRELPAGQRGVVIQHEAISNYMEAMTMPFRVHDTNELAGLHVGDRIEFRLRVREDESWIEGVHRLGAENPVQTGTATPTPTAPAAAPAPAPVNDARPDFRLSFIPDFALTNEWGQPVHLRDFQGRALVMTFFFTRCPLPEFCPRLTKNFAGAVERLRTLPQGPTNYHFLSVSFDPLDTPSVLRGYARQHHYDSNHWSFVTGNPEHIRELARGFQVSVTPTGSTYNHGFATLVFDTVGRLQILWPMSGDLTDSIVSEVVKAARAHEPAP